MNKGFIKISCPDKLGITLIAISMSYFRIPDILRGNNFIHIEYSYFPIVKRLIEDLKSPRDLEFTIQNIKEVK